MEEQKEQAQDEAEAKEIQNLADVVSKISQYKEDVSDANSSEYDHIKRQIYAERVRREQLENEALEGKNKSDDQDREQRKDFAERIFTFVSLYMVAVFAILILSGGFTNFHLSDRVLVTLLRTTTANVIGILLIVVTYLFSRKKK